VNLPPGRANLDFARKLIQHCCWEDARVWKLAIVPLSDEQFSREVGFGLGSIRRECAYIMETERTNLRRILDDAAPEHLSGESATDRAAMHRQWRAIHAEWAQLMGELDGEQFFADRALGEGERGAKLKVWQLVFDVVYQGTSHRSDILRMAAEVNEAPQFDLSLMQFLSGVFRK